MYIRALLNYEHKKTAVLHSKAGFGTPLSALTCVTKSDKNTKKSTTMFNPKLCQFTTTFQRTFAV